MLIPSYNKFLILFLSLLTAFAGKSQTVVKNQLFASGRWIKVETSAIGIHKIDYSWLKARGFLQPGNVRIFGSRNESMPQWNTISSENCPVQLPAMKFKASGGNESLLFYVQGPVSWKYDAVSGEYHHSLNQWARGKSWFYLTEDPGTQLTFPVSEQPVQLPDSQITETDGFAVWEEENINLMESGARWFTAMMMGGNILNRNFQFQDRVEKEPVVARIFAAARSSSPTSMEITAGGSVPGILKFDPVQTNSTTDFASSGSLKISRVLTGSDIALSLKYNGTSSGQCWFDFAAFQFRRKLQYRGIPLLIRDCRSIGSDKIVEYQVAGANAGLQLWEVTNPQLPVQSGYQVLNGLLTFRAGSDSLRSFLLFDPQNQYPGFSGSEEVKNAEFLQGEVPQYLIIAPSAFAGQAERLAQSHRIAGGMSVKVVTAEAIFNEFSGGYPDVQALRNCIRYLYAQKGGSGESVLKYLLLFGKGTCDPVHDPGENNPNWIPSWQSDNSLSTVGSYVSDDFFGLLDPGEGEQGGQVDLGIGRIPAATVAEAAIAVDKILHYHDVQTFGDWRNHITFIGDDEDNNIHVNDSEKLASLLNQNNPEYATPKIYFDAYPQIMTPEERYPLVNEAIRRSVQSGSLIVNYIGHASEDGLAHERVLTLNDIDALTNKDRLPLFVTATCEFSRWDMTVKRSAGEHLFFHPAGGAIALLSATRLVYSASNFEINKSFFRHAFDKDDQGAPLRLGDLIRIVKNENGRSINTSKFCLLGDPALHLNYPEYNCISTEINHQPAEQFSGVLSPLSQVTVSGEIRDKTGKKAEVFNGTLSAVVYDQPAGRKTLGNGGFPSFTYQVQENILFNGSVPVQNGSFTYSFVVPKDVSFNKNAGLIRYYFSNSSTDGNGSFANIRFNGTDIQPVTDDKGPAIRLFLENESFREGDCVSPNPLLMVFLSDESGINTSDFGIGHHITLELDGEVSQQVILNNYYKSDAAGWKSGALFYPLSSL
ncbi:MAG TPA: type IX secretion system sortase PorU, partial [Prolixibacteraceae bacterium]|nr:type IX secretion system sortase PorU [Prolixibacteraceae bacterium]